MKILSRKAAREQGLKHYFTGKPCKHGHFVSYLVSCGRCTQCALLENRARSLRRSREKLPIPTRPEPMLCELCSNTSKTALHLDHDHKTEKFRGWLCGQCNSSIGKLGDDLKGLQNAVFYLQRNSSSLLPTDAGLRKQIPLGTGVLDYFPAALIEIAKVSYAGNQQHNFGQPLHWARNKSSDHFDTLQRHLAERGTVDIDGMRHSAKAAWRMLAILQMELEAEGAPISRGSR